jgi:hypothetical protein
MKKILVAFCLFFSCKMVFAQLTIYADFNLQGASGTCVARTIYTGSSIPNNLNNTIKSISLAQGFMATVAENEDGSGERFTYMAYKSTIHANLAVLLQNKVSYIRVLKIPNIVVKKKGSGNTNNANTQVLNASWFYDWGSFDNSTATREFVPMAWGKGHASDANINIVANKDTTTHYLSFNEPDHDGQADMFVAEALPLYKKMLRTGHRMVSPSCTESQYRVWLDSFSTIANQEHYQIDAVGIHWYDWGNWLSTLNANPNPTDVFNRFKSHIDAVYDFYKKPIWITEFNANVNRVAAVHEGFMNLVLPWMDNDPRIERYAYFFGNDYPIYSSPNVLSPGATTYANHASVDAYPNNIYDTRSAFPVVLAAWNPSTFTQGGRNVASFTATTLATNMSSPSALTRGSGVDLPTTSASDGYWGGNNWSTTTADAGISSNRFISFSLKSTNSKAVNYHSIDKFNIRISNTGPIQYQIQYRLNTGSFQTITTLSGPPRTTGNYVLGPIDLSQIAGLQNVPATSTITFRIVPFDATSNTGSFLIGSGTADTNPDITITGSFSEDNIVPNSLPAVLSNFQLQRISNNVLLSWQTNTEVNFSHFEVEKSDNGSVFSNIATVKGTGNINGNLYSYNHYSSSFGTTYYRLKMVDKDGSFTYSNIIADTYTATATTLKVYPTMVTSNFVNASFAPVGKNAQLKIIDANGKQVAVYALQENSTYKNIETALLSKGIYFVVLQDKATIQSQKFIQ